jgi:hypothetical protein
MGSILIFLKGPTTIKPIDSRFVSLKIRLYALNFIKPPNFHWKRGERGQPIDCGRPSYTGGQHPKYKGLQQGFLGRPSFEETILNLFFNDSLVILYKIYHKLFHFILGLVLKGSFEYYFNF